jgi:hypothetical protein
MLLGLRFFWVTRNLYALIIDTPLDGSEKRLTRIVRYHFPITLLHAVLFFVLCDIFASLAKLSPATADAKPLVDQFILFTVILLALNGLWLLVTFLPAHWRKSADERDETRPAVTWSVLNLGFAATAAVWLHMSSSITSSLTVVLIVVSVLFLANSFLDLRSTAASYIKFPGKPLAR